MKEFKKVLPILDIKYSVFVYDRPVELQNKFKSIEFHPDVEDFNAGVFKHDGRYYLVFLDDGSVTPGVIAHECKHFINLVFEFIHFELDPKNDEMECYFLTYMVDQVYGILK